jgi:hypothetical protein
MAVLKYSTAIESQVDLADIETCLRVRLGDPTPQTREFSRKIMDLLMKLFPERATAFFSSLDPATQKQLQKVAPTAATKPAPAVRALTGYEPSLTLTHGILSGVCAKTCPSA